MSTGPYPGKPIRVVVTSNEGVRRKSARVGLTSFDWAPLVKGGFFQGMATGYVGAGLGLILFQSSNLQSYPGLLISIPLSIVCAFVAFLRVWKSIREENETAEQWDTVEMTRYDRVLDRVFEIPYLFTLTVLPFVSIAPQVFMATLLLFYVADNYYNAELARGAAGVERETAYSKPGPDYFWASLFALSRSLLLTRRWSLSGPRKGAMVDYFLGRSRLNTLLMLILIATLTLITVQSLNGQDGSAFIVALAGLVFVGIAEWIFEPLRNLSDEAWPEDVGILAIEDLAGLEEISTTTREQLARIHSGAFPKEERQYEMAEMLDKIGRRDSLFRLITEDGDAVGYIFMEFAQDPRYGFLWYFAIDPLRRNLDIGEKALANTIERLRQTHPDLKYLLFEVHASRATTDDRAGPDLYDRLRMFYRRSGAYLVRGIDYQIPAAGQDLKAKKRASEPIEYVAYHPMFFALADEIDLAEIRAGVLLMAADEYTDIKDDDTWRSMAADTEIVIVPPPVYLTPAADSD